MTSIRNRLTVLRARLRHRDPRPARMWMRERWAGLLVLALAVLGVCSLDVWLATCGLAGCPSASDIRNFRPSEGSRVLDRNGKLIGRLTFVRRVNVPLARVPLEVREAFIAVEDRRFYHHHGLDWHAAGRALLRNVGAMHVREGFSTITMQVARNAFTPRLVTERTLRRKLLELRLARLIEHNLSKDDILELYLNTIYLGDGSFGVEAASRDLFGKSVSQLSLAEGAMLAALPKGPSTYTPRRNPERARSRRDLVLSLMAREGYVSAQRARRASAQPLVIAQDEWRPPQTNSYAVIAVRAIVDSLLGDDALEQGDVTVYTTIDAAAQRAAEHAVSGQAAEIDRQVWPRRRGDEVQGALVALDPRSGEIRALVGGRRNEPGFDRAIAARRQPGSAFKPFVYAAALSNGMTPATLVDDEPVEIEEGGRVWQPENFGGEYFGRVTLRRALMHSLNAATVRVSRAVGERLVVQTAQRNGIASPLQALPSIALGAFEVTPLELVTAYAPFANGGWRVTPRLVTRLEATDGSTLWTSPETPAARVLDARDAFQLTSMLESVVDEGTGRAVRDLGARGPIAGKTGTTNNGTDVWFVGYTPTLVAGVWFGYDNPRSMGEDAQGGRLAAPAWASFYINGWRERSAEWAPPAGLLARVIDAGNGELATEWCPERQREWFKAGTEPTGYCEEHQEPPEPDVDTIVDSARGIARELRRIFHF